MKRTPRARAKSTRARTKQRESPQPAARLLPEPVPEPAAFPDTTWESGEADAWPTFPIVGVGASAGGLEAFSQLLDALPADSGITMAQEPGTAKFDGMLRAAISTGAVDLVLPPREIALELARSRHPFIQPTAAQTGQVPVIEDQLPRIFTLLRLREERPPGSGGG